VTRIVEYATPAAVGFRFKSPETGTIHELTWIRGEGWLLGVLPAQDSQGWYVTSAPGVKRAATLVEARAIADDFVNGGDSA
jgi:hypothetical protein